MAIELIPICFTANSNNELELSRRYLTYFLEYHNMPYLLTNFIEYQGNNHKHYHSQLFIPSEYKAKVLEYCKKHKPKIYASELINYEYVIKERKPKFINFNSNLQNYDINFIISFFNNIFMAKYNNFSLVSGLYVDIFKKMVVRCCRYNKNFGNNISTGGKKMATEFNEVQLGQLETLINTALERYLNPNSGVLSKLKALYYKCFISSSFYLKK
jgi:hypothetical protein